MKAIIAALQYEEANHTASGVDGIYGNNTLNKAPTLSQGSSQNAYIKIAQMCLMCMMETNAGLDGIFGSELKSLIKEFQEFYCLSSATSGTVDKITWASLLSSKGYSNRPALACDCSTILNAQQASALYNAGYRYVGRYLTGTVGGTRSKAMTSDEISNIITSGLKIFPIFQTGIPSLSRYSYATGKEDAIEAFAAARNLGIPKNTYIYFAIDYDLMDGQLASTVIPYFQGIREIFNQNTSRYLIGVYGARNICSTLHRKGLASSSFVSDMSTGFSGNLGYPIPKNWAFDQFYEYTFTNSGGDFPLDKVAYSGRGRVFSGITDYPSIPEPIEEITDDIIEDFNIKTLSCFTDIFEQLDVLPNLHSSKQLVFPGITIEVSTGIGKTKSIDSKYASASVEIIDGNWKNASINTAINLFKNFCISTGISIDEDMAFNLTYDFSKRIKNGEVSYGIGLASNNKIKLIYLFKEKILNKENREIGWVYSQIEVTLDSQGRDWNQRCLNGLASMSNSLISSERKDYVLYGYIIGFTIIYVYLSKYLFALMLA